MKKYIFKFQLINELIYMKMGFDVNRFVSPIDDKFICSICTMVLQNAIQSSKCQHLFCNECIIQWLAINQTCPLDRGPMVFDDIKPLPDSLRNLLNEQEIKCDFESNGCNTLIKLANLPDHVNQCTYNPNLMVTCDKGCGIEMVKKDYEQTNCFAHLAKLIIVQQKQIAFLMNTRQMWQILNGVRITTSDPIILRHVNGKQLSFAQSIYNLNRDNFYFEIEILELGDSNKISIGLTDSKYPIDKHPGFTRFSVAYHGHNGMIYVKSDCGKNFGPIWKKDDIIGCGVKFGPEKDNVYETVRVYFTKNKQFLGERSITVFDGQLFPSIGMESVGAKVKFIFSAFG